MSQQKTLVSAGLPSFPKRILPACCGLSLALAAGLASPGLVFAADSVTAEEDLPELVVVGSRIRREAVDTASPVQVVTREESTAAGFSSTTELLQSSGLTAGASQINNAYGGFVTDGGPGANTLSLRSLGPSRTLVLINGRRVAPAGTRGAVGAADLNVLPSALVDRIEVLKDGASSIYGSDAIAGVVNVITSTDVTGITLEGQYNRPFEGGGEQSRFSVSGGAAGDRWQFSGSAEFFSRSDLTLGQRDWSSCNTDMLTDPETGALLDYIDPLTRQPKCYTITGTGSNGVTINTIGTPTRAGVPMAGNTGTSFNRWRPNPSVTTGLSGYEGVNSTAFIRGSNFRDTFEPRMLEESMISPVNVWTGFVQGDYELQALGDAQLYGELLINRRTSEQTGYRQLSLDYRLGSVLIPANLVSSTAFLPAQAGGMTGTTPIGVRAFVGFGNDVNEQEVNYYKPTVGIRGDLELLEDWRYDAYVSYSKSDAKYMFQSWLTDKMTYSSDVIVAPTGLDPALNYGGYTCRINTTNPAEACVPIPALNAQTIGGQLPQSWIDYTWHDVDSTTKYQEWVASAAIDGPLMQLPHGALQAVVGFEFRDSSINDQPNPNSVAGNLYNLTSALPTVGNDHVHELFVELEAPLLRDVTFAEDLTVNVSYRYTDYASYGSDHTYKVGVIYSPVNWLSLRGTTGTSYRAPALYEQFQGATSGFLSQTSDPCNNYGTKGGVVAANCATQIPDPAFNATGSITTYSEGGAGSGLRAETSDNLTAGIILQPSLGEAGDLSVELDYFDIRINDGVAKAGALNVLNLCYNDPDFDPAKGYCKLVERGASAPYRLFVSNAFTNLSTQISRGYDFTLRYALPIGPGSLLFTGEATKYIKQAEKLFEDDPLDELNGTIEYPAWTWGLDAKYTLGHWQFHYGADIVGKTDSTEYLEETPGDTIYDFHTGTYITQYASVRFRMDGWEATVGVRNLYDKEPPMISQGAYNRIGNAPLYSAYDYVGRTGFVNITKKF